MRFGVAVAIVVVWGGLLFAQKPKDPSMPRGTRSSAGAGHKSSSSSVLASAAKTNSSSAREVAKIEHESKSHLKTPNATRVASPKTGTPGQVRKQSIRLSRRNGNKTNASNTRRVGRTKVH